MFFTNHTLTRTADKFVKIGGVPYYMDRFRPDRTMADNINTIYFNKDKARQEFKAVATSPMSWKTS